MYFKFCFTAYCLCNSFSSHIRRNSCLKIFPFGSETVRNKETVRTVNQRVFVQILVIFLFFTRCVCLDYHLQSIEQAVMLWRDRIETCRFATLIKTFAEAEARSIRLSFTTLSPGGKMSPAVGGYIGVVLPCCPFLLFSVIESPRLLQFCPLCVCVYGGITWDGMNNCGYSKMLRPDTILLQDYKKGNTHAMPTQVQMCAVC